VRAPPTRAACVASGSPRDSLCACLLADCIHTRARARGGYRACLPPTSASVPAHLVQSCLGREREARALAMACSARPLAAAACCCCVIVTLTRWRQAASWSASATTSLVSALFYGVQRSATCCCGLQLLRDRHTYAMKASGELVCFGYDVSGQRVVRLLAPVLPPHEDYSYDQVCRLGPGAC